MIDDNEDVISNKTHVRPHDTSSLDPNHPSTHATDEDKAFTQLNATNRANGSRQKSPLSKLMQVVEVI